MSKGEYIPNAATKLLLHLNGNSNDESGNGNNGTDTGIIYSQADGRFNQGANFNATSDKILIANESNFDFERTQAFTVSFWFKINTTGVNRFFVTKQVAGGLYNGWAVWQSTGNPILFELVADGTTSKSISVQSSNWTEKTKWHNVIATYDGSGNASGAKIYIDGSYNRPIVNANALGTNTILNNVQVEIGNRNGAFNLNGSIDEVIIENREWTAAEAKKYYTNATKPAIV